MFHFCLLPFAVVVFICFTFSHSQFVYLYLEIFVLSFLRAFTFCLLITCFPWFSLSPFVRYEFQCFLKFSFASFFLFFNSLFRLFAAHKLFCVLISISMIFVFLFLTNFQFPNRNSKTDAYVIINNNPILFRSIKNVIQCYFTLVDFRRFE